MTYLIIFFAVLLAVVTIIWGYKALANEKQSKFEFEVAECKQKLIDAIRKYGSNEFNYRDFCQTHQFNLSVAKQASIEIYSTAYNSALKENIVSEQEEKKLTKLASLIGITSSEAIGIATQKKIDIYRIEFEKAIFSGDFNESAAKDLKELNNALGLGKQELRDASGKIAIDFYVKTFKDIIEDWIITPEEIETLKQLRLATGISKDKANELIRNDAIRVFRKWFANACQDGEVSRKEQESLEWLCNEFDLNSNDTKTMFDRIKRINYLASIRNGKLPTLPTNRLLEGGEICHWDRECEYEWKTTTHRKSAKGVLIVTSKQIIFNSLTKSFSFAPVKVIDIILYSDAVEIRSSSNRGTGTYYCSEPDKLEAIIVGIVRKHKYNLSRQFDSELTRHIPDSVKREVYYRDGGRCVRCESAEYLEYDHIIPRSKGGANSTNNVQLLCRKCNSHKSNRI